MNKRTGNRDVDARLSDAVPDLLEASESVRMYLYAAISALEYQGRQETADGLRKDAERLRAAIAKAKE